MVLTRSLKNLMQRRAVNDPAFAAAFGREESDTMPTSDSTIEKRTGRPRRFPKKGGIRIERRERVIRP